MMERYDFYRITSENKLDAFFDKSSLGDNENIRLLSRNKYLISAVFSYKSTVDSFFENQFGEKQKISYEYWVNVYFHIFNKNNYFWLIIQNPTRNLQRFFKKISDYVSFNELYDKVDLSALYDWVKGFSRLKVMKAKYNNITVSDTTYAVMEISSKSDAIRDIEKLDLGSHNKGNLTKLKAEFIDNGSKVLFEASNNSSFSIDTEDGSQLDWLLDNYDKIFKLKA